MWEWITEMASWPWRDWAVPLITGGFADAIASMTGFTKLKEIRASRDQAQADHDAKVDEVQTQDLTTRFRALMDGYEARIKDLSDDNAKLRAMVRDLERDFEIYRTICDGCAKRAEKLRDLHGRST